VNEKAGSDYCTYEEDDDEYGDEPVGEDDAELDADGDPEHEHGLEEQRDLVVDDGRLLGGVRHLEVVPHRRRGRPHDHACDQTEQARARVSASEPTDRRTRVHRHGTRGAGAGLTFGERGGGLGVEADDEVEHGHEDPAATDAAYGAERRAEEADDGGHHHPPVEREVLWGIQHEVRSCRTGCGWSGGAEEQRERLTGQTRAEREDRRSRTSPLSSEVGSAAESTKQARTAAQAPPATTYERNPRVLALLTRPYSEPAFPSMQAEPREQHATSRENAKRIGREEEERGGGGEEEG
jgi:hypothetical protein